MSVAFIKVIGINHATLRKLNQKKNYITFSSNKGYPVDPEQSRQIKHGACLLLQNP